MILEYFGIYFTAFFVSGIIFTHSEERREGFWKKTLLFIVGMLALAAAILGLPRENEFLIEAVFMAIGCGLNILILHTCFEISWTVAIYNMVWGVSIWEVTVEGVSMLSMLRRMEWPESGGIII